MRRGRQTILGAGYLAALAVLGINAGIVVVSLWKIGAGDHALDRAHDVARKAEHVRSTLLEAESTQRGFLITGQESFLRAHQRAEDLLIPALADLDAAVGPDGPQAQKVVDLRKGVETRLSALRKVIELHERGDQLVVADAVALANNRAIHDSVDGLIEGLEGQEQRLVDEREAGLRSAVDVAKLALGLTTGLGVILLVLLFVRERRLVAERGRAAEAIARERAWLATTLRSLGDAVIATDAVGRVRLMNPVAEALTGWPAAEAVGRPLDDVFRAADEVSRRPVASPVARILRRDGDPAAEPAGPVVLLPKGGGGFPIEDDAAPIRDGAGRPIGVVLVFRDASERRRREADLRAARAGAEAANVAKDGFLATLSHELRTPLNATSLAVSDLLDAGTSATPEEIRAGLETIRDGVGMQARLIDDLLDVTRIVRGKLVLRREVVDAHKVIARAVRTCRGEAERKGVRLTTDLRADERHVNADPARLQQVFWNLLLNAVKFTPAGGSVSVASRREGRNLVVEVADTGIGIAPSALPVIFEAFQQGESAITREFGGIGLGLAISKGIIDRLDGTLAAHSEGRGRGATFRAVLPTVLAPAFRADPTDSSADDVAAARDVPRRILLVEDDPTTRRVLARLLERQGHRVAPAGTIAEALEAIRDDEVDLIVSDIMLPDGDGYDLIHAVAARIGPIPAIALTGFGSADDIRRSRDAGFAAHLTKPIDFNVLRKAIVRTTR